MSKNKGWYEEVLNKVYLGLTLLFRDIDLGNLEQKYKVNMIIKEKGFVDTSRRGGGMLTSHRYAILSNRYADLSEFEHGTNWGLFVINRDAYFKVLDIYKVGEKTQITLLHLPEEDWEVFKNLHTNIDDEIIAYTRRRFSELVGSPPVIELATEEWLNRCRFPLGMDDEGNLFSIFDD